ncbi:DUF4239 domain-containing protein [Nocardia sp. NBC_01730]|uniref:bestrophin-like domain n=1 Tax=Nocardia sp. NBC_01730 TaxID=2975998 RepID=UPI002E0F90F3|nr:DUF4239 domain-containing protein [Nocardia sp. NBC_01730]
MVLQWALPVLSALVAVSVLVLANRLRPESWRKNEEEGADGLVLEIISTFFTAVVALVVVIGWQNYDNAHSHTVAEAKALVEVHSAADKLPQAERDRIQGLVRDYTTQVLGSEWPVMAEKRQLSESTQQTFDKLRAEAAALRDADDERSSVLAGLGRVAQARYDRAMDASLSIPGFLYAALWFGTALLLLRMVLADQEITRRSMLMTAVLGVVVGWVILAIYNLDRPFSGGSVVPRDAFELALTRFRNGS